VDDLGGEGRGSRPGSGMLDPLLLLLERPLSSRSLPVTLFLSFSRSFSRSDFVSLYVLFVHDGIVVEKKEEGGGREGRGDDKGRG